MHTKGPWTATLKWGLAPHWVVKDGDGGLLARVARLGEDEDPEGDANAKMVTAAPELLDALRNLVADMERILGRELPGDHEAKAAVAKAEGR